MKIKILLLLALSIQFLSAQSIDYTKGYVVEDYLSQTSIDGIALSPDGHHMAFITNHDDFIDNKTIDRLYYYHIDDNGNVLNQQQILEDASGFSNLRWTPDSKNLLFKAKDSVGTTVFQMSVSAPNQITPVVADRTLLDKLKFFQIKNNTEVIFNTTYDPSTQKSNNDILYFPPPKKEMHSTYKSFTIGSNRIDSLFTIPYNTYRFEISPDKKSILFSDNPIFSYYSVDSYKNAHTYMLTLDNPKNAKQVTFHSYWEYCSWWSNDKVISIPAGNIDLKKDNRSYSQFRIIDINTLSNTPLSDNFDHRIQDYLVINEDELIIQADSSTSSYFYHYDKDKIRKVTNKNATLNHLKRGSNGAYVFAQVTEDNFEEIYFAKSIDELKNPKKLTSFNDELSKQPKPTIETVRWKNSDGIYVEGVLFTPPGVSKKENLPLVVDIHGGPFSSRNEVLSLNGLQYYYYGSLLATKGFMVLQPNYRGGTGRGQAFMDAINGFPRSRPVDDILTGVGHLIDQKWVDPDRMVVMGASYGGHLTNSLLGATNQFKVGLPSCGIWSEIANYGVNDGDIMKMVVFDGKNPVDDLELYRRESPNYEMLNIKTPTLITHGEKDIRVPTSNAYMMYYTLKDLDVDVEMMIFKDEGHTYSKPSNKLAKVKAELEFIKRYLPK